MTEKTDPRYPIGKYVPQPFSSALKEEWIADIRFLPNLIEQSVQNLDEAQLHTAYRDGGWTVHQLVHHVADSHINAYCRFKMGLTADNPTIVAYDEGEWAKMADTRLLPVNISITLLYALHQRWVKILESIKDPEWERTIFHPEHKKTITLWHLLGLYAWHSKHHTAHIVRLREQRNW